jgi:hypothetical protein
MRPWDARHSRLRKQLERVNPVVAEESRDAPEHTERLDGAGRLGLSHIRRLPTELIQDSR